jgi:pyruvate kinase
MPTRAEITDVANAVFEQADATMLSGETTVGKYPLRCIEVFDKIARRIEASGGANYQLEARFTSPRQKLVKSAVVMADQLKAEAIIVFTVRGHMARHVAWLRPKFSKVYAICETQSVADTLSLSWGLKAMVLPFDHAVPEKTIDRALQMLTSQELLDRRDTAVVISAISSGENIVDGIQMRQIA